MKICSGCNIIWKNINDQWTTATKIIDTHLDCNISLSRSQLYRTLSIFSFLFLLITNNSQWWHHRLLFNSMKIIIMMKQNQVYYFILLENYYKTKAKIKTIGLDCRGEKKIQVFCLRIIDIYNQKIISNKKIKLFVQNISKISKFDTKASFCFYFWFALKEYMPIL